MTTLWYSTAEDPEEYTDHVTLKGTATEEKIDNAVSRIMRENETDHLHYAVQVEGKWQFASVSICRP